MSEYRLTREERETHIYFSDADDTMEVFTESPAMIRKLEKVAPEYNADLQEAGYHGVRVLLPKKALTIRKPRVLSDEQRKAMADRLKEARSKR